MPPKRSLNLEINADKHKKRNRKSVTLDTKLEVLRRIEAGEKIVQICYAMGLAKSTVQSIRDRKEEIKTYSLAAGPLSASKLTRQRSSIMEKMETLLYMWIEDNVQRRTPMSHMTIQEKAKSIFEKLKRDDTDESVKDVTFQGSRGWLEKFKNRHNLHNSKTKSERDSAEDDAAKECPNVLSRIIERGRHQSEQSFNVDETELCWNSENPRCYKAFKANYLSRTFSKLMHETDGESSIKHFRKNNTIRDAGDNISQSWKELKSIANNLGFENLEEGDFKHFLDADPEPLSNEELIQLETEQAIDEESEPAICQQLTAKHLSNALSYFEQGMSIILQNDPDQERSARMSRRINSAIACYKALHKEAENKA